MHQRRYSLCFWFIIVFLTSLCPVKATNADTAEAVYPQPVAKAALLMDASSGRVLYEKNAHEQLPPASVTKIMTALLAVENGNLDQEVTISKNAAETPESSVWLEEGEKLTGEQLLYACMLHSANDAAVALAENVAGSEERFVQLMNQRAQQLGMKDTHFCNPHGLQNADHYTTAYDLGLLSREALKHSDFRQVVSTKTINIPWTGKDYDRLLVNQNRLLYRYEGTIGIKTGYTKVAGNCVVGAAQKGSFVLIAVALNSASVYEDLEQMLDYGFANYSLKTVATAEQLSTTVPVENGEAETVAVRANRDLSLAIKAQELSQLSYQLFPQKSVKAPVQEGQVLGYCKMLVGGIEVGEADLIACSSVSEKPPILTVFKAGLISISKPILIISGCILVIRQVNLRRYRKKRLKKPSKRFKY